MSPESRSTPREDHPSREVVAPLFPLPNVLLYPEAMLPLHIFEPRYVRMIEDIQESGDTQIVMGLLQPGATDEDYFGKPPIYALAGLGRVTHVGAVPDGRYNILVRGMSRVAVEEELDDDDKPYRRVRVRCLEEQSISDVSEKQLLHTALRDGLIEFADGSLILQPDARVSYLADVLLIALPIPIEEKQALFGILDVAERARAVLQILRGRDRLRESFQGLDDQGDNAPWN